jgi:diguanylate cyclase (GGDEF)-like protein/PAS domain S-box-containing protein
VPPSSQLFTVIVVDDRVTNRNILSRLAASVAEGLRVRAFASPLEALAWTETTVPDLVITDFKMPEMNGAAFIRAFRERPGCHDVPVVVVTVYEDRSFCYQALEAGATDFLLSPFDHVEFRARARNLLTLRKQQRLLEERAEALERRLADHDTGAGLAPLGLEERLQRVLDSVPAVLSAVDRSGRYVLVNRWHEQLYATPRERALGRSVAEVHGDDYATHHEVLHQKVLECGAVLPAAEQEVVDRDGEERVLLTTKAPLRDVAGRVMQVMTLSVDVTGLKRAEALMRHQTQHDPLTGLPNRDLFLDRFGQAIAAARRADGMLALLLLDLDRFKGVNEMCGHGGGDQLLREVAARLGAQLEETDTLARLGGDEFAMLRTGLKRPDDADELARRLCQVFATPFIHDGQELHTSASLGIALFPDDGGQAEQLLRNAELAMYKAKASGRNGYRFFSIEMNLAARRAVVMERELRQALAAEQFATFYQPQLELQSGRIVGLEALVRWRHPERGLVRPGEFIGPAEDLGLIGPLSAWVLEDACRQLRHWQEAGIDGLQLSVNLSPVQFRERGIELLIERILAETGLPSACLDIELTENAVMEHSEAAIASLRYLHQLGVSLSLDDFGTGYSSLSYVKRLPVRRLKIDRSFVHNLGHSQHDEVIVRAIINLGHSLGLKVIGEGVETVAQLGHLRRLGCDEVQGDLISPPMPAEEVPPRLARAGRLVVVGG